MKIPKPILKLIESFESLPGIGPKTAQRLVFYLFHFPQTELEKFAQALINLKLETRLCSICKNIDDTDPCSICQDISRDANKLIVVSSPLDVIAFEKVGFKGKYHVLHGIINPLNNIGPDDIFINNLITRLKNLENEMEIIIATNTTMEGESTALYISKLISQDTFISDRVKITRIGRGLPVGGDVEYADDLTLTHSLENRRSL